MRPPLKQINPKRASMKTIIASLCLVIAATAHARDTINPDVTYSGGGRYTCPGGGAACAQIDTNNRVNTELERQRYQAQQDRADRYIREERARRERDLNSDYRRSSPY